MIGKITDYLRTFKDPTGKRKRLRLPVRIPVLYAFPDLIEKGFRQGMTVDVSSSGLQIEVLGIPSDIFERLKMLESEIVLKFDMDRKKGFLELKGKIKWLKTDETQERVYVGIEFIEGISIDTQIELMSFAIHNARIKMFKKAGLVAASFLFIVVAVVAGVLYHNKSIVGKDLNASQRILEKMEKKLQELAAEKMMLEEQINKLKEKQRY